MVWWPSLSLGIDFTGTYQTDPPSFTDLTSVALAAEGFAIRRQRSRQLDRMETGTLAFSLDNRTGTYNPRNTASAYYPIELALPARVQATYDAVTYDLYRGFSEIWKAVPDQERPRVDVSCSDAFKLFNGWDNLTGSFSAGTSDKRIGDVLDAIAWPAALRDLEVGLTTIQASDLTDANVLEHLRKVADSEFGVLYHRGDGDIVFHNRHHRSTSPYNTVQATFGGVGGLPYESLDLPYDDTNVRNYISVTREGSTAQVEQSAASQAKYGLRSLSRTGMLMDTDAEAASQSSWILFRWKDGEPEIDSIVLRGRDDATLWPQMLGRDVGDRVRILRTQEGDDIDMTVIIESVSHTIREKGSQWETVWRCSPVRFWGFWIVESSMVEVDTVVGY